jgi:hypothetical protein
LRSVTQIAVPVVVRDLTADDLGSLGWSGSPVHLASVREQIARVPSGEVEYLAACLPPGAPVGKLEIDYADCAGAGTLCQAAVHPVLQSCGIGTLLVRVAEMRIMARGLTTAELAVEHGDEPDGWDAEGADGRIDRLWGFRAGRASRPRPVGASMVVGRPLVTFRQDGPWKLPARAWHFDYVTSRLPGSARQLAQRPAGYRYGDVGVGGLGALVNPVAREV